MNIVKFFSKQRVLTATIFIAITMAACILGGWLWALFVIVLACVGVNELTKMLSIKEIYPATELVYIFILILIALAYLNRPEYFIHVIVAASIICFIWFLFKKTKTSCADIFSTIFMILYTGLPPVYFIMIRNNLPTDTAIASNTVLDVGGGFLLLVLMGIWASDIGAYYVGKNFGKHKLCPLVSPNKTIEGAIGGTLAGIIAAVIMGSIIQLSLVHSIILGLIVVIMAQLGDLCESLLKRDIGVKDSGDIVPGHGGILDRADSYLFTATASFYYIYYIILV